MTGDPIDLERHLPVPVDRVRAALTDPSQAGTWFAAKARITPEPGGAYELFRQTDTPGQQSTIGCRITAIAPCRYLALTWRGPDELSAVMNEADPPPPPTHATISLTSSPGGTDLRVRHPDPARARTGHAGRGKHDGCHDRRVQVIEAGRSLTSRTRTVVPGESGRHAQ